MPIFSEQSRGSRPWRLELVEDRQHVAGRHHDHVGTEVGDQLHLPLGHAARHRHHGAAQLLRAVMRAEAAGEQAIAIGDVHDHARPPAGGMDRARHHMRPGLDVLRGVADDGRLAGGAGRGVHAHQLLARHGEHAERIVRAQVLLGGERELRDVVECAEIVRMHAGAIERGAVVRHVRRRRGAASTPAARAAARRSRRARRFRSHRARLAMLIPPQLAAERCANGRGTPPPARRPRSQTRTS